MRALLLSHVDPNSTLSYQTLWWRNFERHSIWKCRNANIAETPSPHLADRLTSFDIIILMPSIFSNTKKINAEWHRFVRKSRAFKAYIIGNEYKLIPEKMSFCDGLDVNLALSMLLPESVKLAYQSRFGRAVVKSWLFSALDPDIFHPGPPMTKRTIDIGYRCSPGVWYAGHRDRESIAAPFEELGRQGCLKVDISGRPEDRFDTAGFAEFLRRCRATLGCEAGVDAYDPTDGIRNRVNRRLKEDPSVAFETIIRDYFTSPNPISGRIASSRHFEASGTGTLQILYEGRYSDMLKAREHYVPLKKDHSNIPEVLEVLTDHAVCERITTSAMKEALERHTYAHRVRELESIVGGLV